MTAKHRRHLGVFAPKQLFADNRYAVDQLDNSRQDILPRYRRDGAPDDPWLSPTRSEAVRALLLYVQAATHSPDCEAPPDGSELDLEAFCRDAELDESETEVVSLAAEGWVQRQIAEWLGFSQATVCRRLTTGRRKLAGWLPLAVVHRLEAS